MKQQIKKAAKVMGEGLLLVWQDVRNLWPALLVLVLYFLLGKFVLHSLCPSVILTGFPCPGCGMTRAMLSILRGDFASAWRFHPFSYVLLMWAAAFGIRRYILQKDVKILMKCLIVILIGMLVFYVYRMVRYFPGEPPMSYDESRRLYRLYRLWKGNV